MQTRKAESSLEALRDLFAPEATVIREGETETIPARALIQGDIVLLEAGDYVPADGRLLETSFVKVDEGMLTGAICSGALTLSGFGTLWGIHGGVIGLILNLLICVAGSYMTSVSTDHQRQAEEKMAMNL